MNFQKSLNRQYSGKWVLILILANKLKTYYLAKKISSMLHPSLYFTVNPIHQVPKALAFVLRSKIKFWWTYSVHLKYNLQNHWVDQKATTSHTEGSLVSFVNPSLDLTLFTGTLFMIVHLTVISQISWSLLNMTLH